MSKRKLMVSEGAVRASRGESSSELTEAPVRRGRWSDAEKLLLRELYGTRSMKEIVQILGRPRKSVERMVTQLFRANKRQGPWAAAEIQQLKHFLGTAKVGVIARILGREVREVETKIYELGRLQNSGEWSRHELVELKRLYGTRTNADLATIFGRSVDSIREKAESLHLAKDKAFLRKQEGHRGASRMPRWSKEEIELLGELYSLKSNLEIAHELKRSVKSVVSKAHNMGLKKDVGRLREMGRQNVSHRYDTRDDAKDGTGDEARADPKLDEAKRGS